LIALLAAGARIQLAARSGALRIRRVAEAAIQHLLETPLDEAPLHEHVLTSIPEERAGRVAHHPMGVILAMYGLP
jgi:hypothetical protein